MDRRWLPRLLKLKIIQPLHVPVRGMIKKCGNRK
jgi:hypothetical protein